MTRRMPDIDASTLPVDLTRRHPLWWGILGAVTIEATVVATMIVSYFYLAAGAEAWPPDGAKPPAPLLPSVNVVLLLTSSFTMWLAGWGIDRNRRGVLVFGTAASVVLAVLVLVLRWIELGALGFRWDSHPYGSIVWTMMGFHFVHVASAIIGTAVVSLLAAMGYFAPDRKLGVVVDTLYWYFVAGIWVPLYAVLVWSPRLLGGGG